MATIELSNPIAGAGLGDPLRCAGAPTSGPAGTGTFAGKAPKGALLIDTTNAFLYQNTGTQASPVWTKVGTEV